MALGNKNFHHSMEMAAIPLWLRDVPRGADKVEKGIKQVTVQEREMSYRFYLHQHPYVTPLIQRLIQRAVRGLQDADTEYVEHKDGTLRTLPGSTQVALAADLVLNPADGPPQTLAAGTQLTLPDGTLVTLADGGQTILPGDMIVTEPRGMRVQVAGVAQDVAFGDGLTLVENTFFILPDSSPETIPAGTGLTLLRCQPMPKLFAPIFSAAHYAPTQMVQLPYPAKDLDFTFSGAYAVYNWELFFHAPLTIALHLSKNGRYEEAMQWFHFIFDPTDDSDAPAPERFWKVKPFQYTDVQRVEEILVNLSTGEDSRLREATVRSIEAWKDDPFRPHVVARYRQTAYMYKTVMAYLDNLIDWADSLFRQDTGESINEASQLYVIAANILGPRPQPVPKKGSLQPQTYVTLRANLDAFGNALREMESNLPFDLLPHPGEPGQSSGLITLQNIGRSLYFCVPRNDKLLRYWDTVADRLFKIRNSLNIQGIFRQLPLFEPPIDPALLARAAAAGLDIGAVVAGVNQPLPLVRFAVLAQKATEICQEVKSLGSQLLAAIEKEDNEALALLRAQHESAILDLTEMIKYAQWQEAIKAREGLEQSLASTFQRYVYYERQLGREQNEIELPASPAFDSKGLAEFKYRNEEAAVDLRPITMDIAQNLNESGGKIVSSYEQQELEKLAEARTLQDVVQAIRLGGQAISLLPQFGIKFHFWGLGGDAEYGGFNLGKIAQFAADVTAALAERKGYEAGNAARIGNYARREQDWAFQSNLAAGELTQIYKQLRAAQIREAIAERDWHNHQIQIKHAQEIAHFLKGEEVNINENRHKKVSTQAFYTWLKREVKGLYNQAFQFAFDVARKAERALQHELNDPSLQYLQFGYLAGKEGLLAGEKLYLDLKRMEMAYHDLNRREYELVKHVSLLQVDGLALLALRMTGSCTVTLPESLFDLDGPGHYFRRINTVAVSIPCITGPYASVNCTLTLLKSAIRTQPTLQEGEYRRAGAEDSRFNDYFGSLQSIVTSSGQNDSGLFETNLRDERYLPFENSGVISEWRLALPADPSNNDPAQFDYNTISDVILHIRYTAREGGSLLRGGALSNIEAEIEATQAAGSVRLFSIRHDFATAWARFKNVKIEGDLKTAALTLNLRPEHYPYWSHGRIKQLTRIELFAKGAANPIGVSDGPDPEADGTLSDALDAPLYGLRNGLLSNIALPNPTDEFTLYFDQNDLDELWMAVTWGTEP